MNLSADASWRQAHSGYLQTSTASAAAGGSQNSKTINALADAKRTAPMVTAAAKAAAHWLSTGVPLIIATPVLAILLNLEAAAYGPLILSLLIGTPGLSLIGAFAAALTVSLPRASLLISIIVSPLYVPILIFGAGAASAGAAGDPQFAANLIILGASTLFAAIFAPIASAAALRSNLD
jgi:heme exporter protein B